MEPRLVDHFIPVLAIGRMGELQIYRRLSLLLRKRIDMTASRCERKPKFKFYYRLTHHLCYSWLPMADPSSNLPTHQTCQSPHASMLPEIFSGWTWGHKQPSRRMDSTESDNVNAAVEKHLSEISHLNKVSVVRWEDSA
jgi:hypothetical protein